MFICQDVNAAKHNSKKFHVRKLLTFYHLLFCLPLCFLIVLVCHSPSLPSVLFLSLSLFRSRACLHWLVMRTVKCGRTCAGLLSCCWKSALTASSHTCTASSRCVCDSIWNTILNSQLLALAFFVFLITSCCLLPVHVAAHPGPRWERGSGGVWVLADSGWTAHL